MKRLETLLLRDDIFLRHDPGPGHPENAERLVAVHASLDNSPMSRVTTEAPPVATRATLLRVHSAAHVDAVAASAGRLAVQLDADTATSAESWDAARHAAGAACRATEAVLSGSHQGAFALVRPPGHHAEAASPMGFCLFNNIAVAAAHAVAELDCRRVLVLDPDVHHGNGTQHVFEDRAEVLYVSSHRFPFYPGTGWLTETGRGAGAGYTINLPLIAGCGDGDLLHVYRNVVGPVVDEWKPELILVSAGFDTWHNDPLGGLAVTAEGFAALFALFRAWSDRHCPGRLVAALEGGYDPAGVTAGVRAALAAMSGPPPDQDAGRVEALACPETLAMTRRVRAELARHWSALASS